jgi:hypothetical protein
VKKLELVQLIKEVIIELQGAKGKWNISKIDFLKFRDLVKGKEGIVLLGAGGNLNEWVDGVVDVLFKEKIVDVSDPGNIFDSAYELKSTGGRSDLALIFNKNAKINIGKMAMWRLRFGDCSWISDFIVNYAEHYGVEKAPEEYGEENDDE